MTKRRTGADALPGWRETPAKQAVLDFVHAVTAPDSPDSVEEPDRIAVFDNDGTLVDRAAGIRAAGFRLGPGGRAKVTACPRTG